MNISGSDYTFGLHYADLIQAAYQVPRSIKTLYGSLLMLVQLGFGHKGALRFLRNCLGAPVVRNIFASDLSLRRVDLNPEVTPAFFGGVLDQRDVTYPSGVHDVLPSRLVGVDPQHDSALTHLLTRATSMPVREVTNNLRVQANCVYVIPPNTNFCIANAVLEPQPRLTAGAHQSIDLFF